MNALELQGLTKHYKDFTLGPLDLTLPGGTICGLIGENGAGKSTLMKVFAGANPDYTGEVYLNDKVVELRTPMAAKKLGIQIVYQEVDMALVPTLSVAENVMLNDMVMSAKGKPLMNWAQLRTDAKRVLEKLHIDVNVRTLVQDLSLAQKQMVLIARAIANECNFLILDEPTNHMDNATVAWLEQKLLARKGALLMVTHDRYFFDRVVNRTLEIDGGKGYVYVGNYSLFLQKREERRIAEASAAQKLRNIYRRELAWISRGAEARRTKKKDRVERFAQIEAEVKNVKTEANLEMSSVSSRLGKTIIELEDIGMVWDGKDYIKDFSYILLRNDRIGIVGPNGAGKSTLMDIIAGKLQPTSGEMRVGQTVKIGYFAQHSEFPDSNMRVLEYIKEANNYIETADGQRISAAQMLERFLFPPELQWVPVSKLSGGEKRRLYLLRVLMTAPNVLLLDEPTNDLDIPTLSVLEDYLDSFAGAVIAVSHDRYFLDRFAQKIFALEQDGSIKPYIGGYSDYAEALQEEGAQQAQPVKAKPVAAAKPAEEPAKKKMTYGERLELERLDQEIARSEAELKMLAAEINQCGSDFTRLADLTKQQEGVQQKLDEMVDRWAYLSELAEAEG